MKIDALIAEYPVPSSGYSEWGYLGPTPAASGASAGRDPNCRRQPNCETGRLRDCETGQLGSGTRFQMHFACVIKMSLIYDQAGPNLGQMQAERIARVSTLWLPLAERERERVRERERERRSTFSHRVAGE